MPRVQEVITSSGVVVHRTPVIGDLKWSGTVWRRWNGRKWSKAAYSLHSEQLRDPSFPEGRPALSEASQRRALDLAVEDQIATNAATVVFSGPTGTTLGYRRRVSHVFHAILTFLTAGLWAIGWLAFALSAGEDRVRFDVDSWGDVWMVPMAKARR